MVIPGDIKDVREIRVLEWHGPEKRAFVPGDLMVELETHKALVEVRAGQHGILRAVLCHAGEWGKIGEPLAVLSDEADEVLPTSADDLASWEAVFQIT